MAGLTTVSQAQQHAITYSEASEYLRLDEQQDVDLIRSLIRSATNYVETYTGRSLINRTLKYSIDHLNEVDLPLHEGMRTGADISIRQRHLELPKPPVSSVTSIITFDDSDNATTFASSKYYVDNQREPARIILRTGEVFPTALRVGNAVEVTYVSGYGSAGSSVPEAMRLAMLQFVTFNYEHRGDTEGKTPMLPQNIRSFLDPFKVLNFSRNPFGGYGGY
jgi:hypothetical protein